MKRCVSKVNKRSLDIVYRCDYLGPCKKRTLPVESVLTCVCCRGCPHRVPYGCMGDWSPILDTTPESMLYACFVPDEKWGYPAPGPRRSPVMRSTARPWFKVNSWRSTVGEFHDEWKGVTSDTRSEGVSPDTLLPIDTRNAPEGVTRDVRSEGTDGAGTLGGVREAVRPRASTLDRKITFQTVTRGG